MKVVDRIKRHIRLSRMNYGELPSPPFLVLFINSLCNMKCDHCFYWRSLNGKDDLTKEELFELSRSLGKIENLNLSGGEPFLRKEFAEICRQWKDPKRTGDKDLNAMVKHLAEDAAIAWSWAPGGTRSTPPGSQADLARYAEAWVDTGAVCPEE